MKEKKGFTLIELLAVIIILGILLIIAIPSVTEYISSSRKETYVASAKQLVDGARTLVNSGKLDVHDTDTTYYINSKCISTEKEKQSPYGEFTKSYIVVTYDGDGYNYYWTSVDTAGQGVKDVLSVDKLEKEDIVSGIKKVDIDESKRVENNSKYVIIDESCSVGEVQESKEECNALTGFEGVHVYVDCEIIMVGDYPAFGDTILLTTTYTGLNESCDDSKVKFSWEYRKSGSDEEWTVVEGDTLLGGSYYMSENGDELRFLLTLDNYTTEWRSRMTYVR